MFDEAYQPIKIFVVDYSLYVHATKFGPGFAQSSQQPVNGLNLLNEIQSSTQF